MKKILVAGTIAFDEVTTPMGYSGKQAGGSATYLALAAAHFNADLGMISIVGHDFPLSYLKEFEKRNINIEGIEIHPVEKTFYWKGYYYENMNRRDTLVTQVNALKEFKPHVPPAHRNSDLIALGNLHPAIQLEILNQIEKRPALIMLDTMNYWMENAYEELLKVLKKIDLLLVNEEEIRQLTGEYFLHEAVSAVRRLGPSHVIIKQGEYGSMLFTPDGFFSAPAYPVKRVYDPTGAGDSYAGGFIGHLSRYECIDFEAMKNAVICGANLASFCVEDFGIKRLLNLQTEEIRNRLIELVNMTRFSLQNKSV